MLEYLGSHISILQELLIKLNILGIKSLFSLEQRFWNMSHNHKLKKKHLAPKHVFPISRWEVDFFYSQRFPNYLYSASHSLFQMSFIFLVWTVCFCN